MEPKKVPGWLRLLLVGGAFGALVWWERRRPLRRSVEPKLPRDPRNLAVAAISAAVLQVAVTPRMHGIHHSVVEEETNSNWSRGLALWDWLHGTLKINIPQQETTIGVPAFRSPEEVT
jgi:hypothetical protein